jgi:hypothetical protein
MHAQCSRMELETDTFIFTHRSLSSTSSLTAKVHQRRLERCDVTWCRQVRKERFSVLRILSRIELLGKVAFPLLVLGAAAFLDCRPLPYQCRAQGANPIQTLSWSLSFLASTCCSVSVQVPYCALNDALERSLDTKPLHAPEEQVSRAC